MNAAEYYKSFRSQLEAIYDPRESDNITDWIFENIGGLKRWQRTQDQQLSKVVMDQLLHALQLLLQHTPVQYVLHEAWFYKRKFWVDENVLIPRPETEELVEWIISEYLEEKSPISILDIGSGSGCIPISLRLELPQSRVTSVDISKSAINIAHKNASLLSADVDFKEVDFLNELLWKDLGKYNVIVSNPPYIPQSEKQMLAKNVTDFEPSIALFVPDEDPLIFYKKIALFAKTHLHHSGKVFVEVHENYCAETLNIFESAGFNAKQKNDLFGKERMIQAKLI